MDGPTRKEIAYIAGVNDKKLENWLTRGVVVLDEKQASRRWRRFTFADGLRVAFIHELSKYGVEALMANFLVSMMFEYKIADDSGKLYTFMIQTEAGGKLMTLPEMSNEDAARFLAALDGYRWVLNCELDQSGPDLVPAYHHDFLTKDEPLPEGWESCIVVNFKPIIDRVLNRWDEIISKKNKEKV